MGLLCIFVLGGGALNSRLPDFENVRAIKKVEKEIMQPRNGQFGVYGNL